MAYYLCGVGNEPHNMMLLDQPINPSKSGDVLAFYLAGYPVYIRISGQTISLVSIKTDSTESVVNIITNAVEAVAEYFEIYEIHYLSASVVQICFHYPTNEARTNISANYARTISMKSDRSIYAYGQMQIGTASTATATGFGVLFRGFYGDYANVRSTLTISNNNRSLVAYPAYNIFSTSRIVVDSNTALVNISTADPDVEIQDVDRSIFRGGFFYTNATGVKNVLLQANTTSPSSARAITLANAGSSLSDYLIDDTAMHTYFLGFMKCGLLILARIINNVAHITAWMYDHTSATSLFKPYSSTEFNQNNISLASNENIVSFTDDEIITSLGNRYLIEYDASNSNIKITSKPAYAVTHGWISGMSAKEVFNKMGAKSDPYNGVFIY